MGFIRQKMKVAFDAPFSKSWDTDDDEAITPYVIAIDATATDASTFTYALKNKVRVIDAFCISAVANGGATAQIQDNDGNAITNAMDISSNKALSGATEIDDANWEESSGNNLKVVQNANGDSCYAFIVVVPIK
jgi:hypothetical protein